MHLAAAHFPLSSATLVVGGRGVYMGLIVDETAAGAATFTVYDGINSSGRPIDYVRLASGGNDRRWFGPNGIHFEQGLYIGTVTGTVQGQVLFVAQTIQTMALIVDEVASDRRLRPYLTQVTIDDFVAEHIDGSDY